MSLNSPGSDNMFQHGATQPPLTPKMPHYAFFPSKMFKNLSILF